jgi:hypothetical protein
VFSVDEACNLSLVLLGFVLSICLNLQQCQNFGHPSSMGECVLARCNKVEDRYAAACGTIMPGTLSANDAGTRNSEHTVRICAVNNGRMMVWHSREHSCTFAQLDYTQVTPIGSQPQMTAFRCKEGE